MPNWMKVLVGTLALALCLGGAIAPGMAQQPLLPPPVLAQSSSTSLQELQQKQRQLEQQRSRINQQQQQLQNQQTAAEGRLEGLQDTIATTSAKIADNEKQLATANQKLKELQAALDKAEKSYQERQFSTVARLRFLQRQQGGQGWAVLLQSQSLNDFIDRRRQLKLVYEADRGILEDLQAQAEALDTQRRGVEAQKNQVALITQQLQAQKAELQAQAQTQESLINRLRTDRQALEAAESQLDRDSANLTSLIQQRLAAQTRGQIVVSGTGQFSLPSSGRVTSGFGQRVHPILGYRRFHAGIDFGASHGSPIRAADSGTVIFSGWYGGYGRAVVVSHGGGLTTLYAHASEIYVSEGQGVQRGQAIAAIGSTGLATGPHLHFEVRVNGSPVNPLNYL